MNDLFFYYGEKTCDLMRHIWIEPGNCHLLNITKPLSLVTFRGEYIAMGQQSMLLSLLSLGFLAAFLTMKLMAK